MRGDVRTYVSSCTVCQLTKPSQLKPAGLLVPVHANEPWEYVGAHFYILVFVDYFSKWVEASAVREANAQVAASKFVGDIFARHGAPRHLISDRGAPFVSALFNKVVEMVGSDHRLTTAYHPQTNATERINRTLKTAIRAYVGDKQTSWDRYIPQICFALRTAPHESTGFSPARMLYGRELATPLDHLIQPPTDYLNDPMLSRSDVLRSTLSMTHDHARVALEASHEKQKRHYDLRRRPVEYAPGDLVRLKTLPRSDAAANFAAKLAPLYGGPYRIMQRLSEVNYRLASVDGAQDLGVVHVVNLQPFHTWQTAEAKTHCTSYRLVAPSFNINT
uniref:Integrase catalytic domain-containing protein n=1 Tax=Sinocyclocheilus anshuiensis TaxID=1608454 RepID=A0A671LWW9_9TELE